MAMSAFMPGRRTPRSSRPTRWAGNRRHLADSLGEGDDAPLPDVPAEHPHERAVAARVRRRSAEDGHLAVGGDHRDRVLEDALEIRFVDRMEDPGGPSSLDDPHHGLGGLVQCRPGAARPVISARFLPARDGSQPHAAIWTFFGSPPPRSYISDSMMAFFDAGALRRVTQACDDVGLGPLQRPRGQQGVMPVLDAVYGYWSMVTSTPRAAGLGHQLQGLDAAAPVGRADDFCGG